MVEWNRANIVVKNVGLNDAVEEGTTNKPKLTINCRSGTTSISPSRWSVVR
jgi:hypothetical protein